MCCTTLNKLFYDRWMFDGFLFFGIASRISNQRDLILTRDKWKCIKQHLHCFIALNYSEYDDTSILNVKMRKRKVLSETEERGNIDKQRHSSHAVIITAYCILHNVSWCVNPSIDSIQDAIHSKLREAQHVSTQKDSSTKIHCS